MTKAQELRAAKRVYMYLTPAMAASGITMRVAKFTVRDAVDTLSDYSHEIATWNYDEQTRTLHISWAT